MSLLARLVPLLLRRPLVLLANVVGDVAYIFDRRGRKFALANIQAAFGDRYSPAQRAKIARASCRNFSRTMLDLFWSRSLTPENYRRYLKVENIQVLQQLRARGESAIILCIHHGNFEWASLAAGFEGFPTTIVAKEFKNPWIGEIFQTCRQVSGHRIIVQKSSMIRLLKHVRRGGFSGMLLDLNRNPREAATVIRTFGMAMCVTFMHAVLAQRGGARLVPLEGRSQPDGTCRVIFHEPLEMPEGIDHRELTQRCWDFFAPIIATEPEQWMWFYPHWRFNPSNEGADYPFYSRSDPEFERLYQEAFGGKKGPIILASDSWHPRAVLT